MPQPGFLGGGGSVTAPFFILCLSLTPPPSFSYPPFTFMLQPLCVVLQKVCACACAWRERREVLRVTQSPPQSRVSLHRSATTPCSGHDKPDLTACLMGRVTRAHPSLHPRRSAPGPGGGDESDKMLPDGVAAAPSADSARV